MIEPDVRAALQRAGLPHSGPVPLFHATDGAAAAAIAATGLMYGDCNRQVWLASSPEIAALEHGAGVTRSVDGQEREVDALLEVQVDAERLYWQEARAGEEGEVELFFLLDEGDGCAVEVLANEPWSAKPPAWREGP